MSDASITLAVWCLDCAEASDAPFTTAAVTLRTVEPGDHVELVGLPWSHPARKPDAIPASCDTCGGWVAIGADGLELHRMAGRPLLAPGVTPNGRILLVRPLPP